MLQYDNQETVCRIIVYSYHEKVKKLSLNIVNVVFAVLFVITALSLL